MNVQLQIIVLTFIFTFIMATEENVHLQQLQAGEEAQRR